MTWSIAVGAVLALALAVWLGVWASRLAALRPAGSKKSAAPQPVRADSWWAVGGSSTGLLAGGTVAIGTAQLAFTDGWSAWWFTVGAGVGLALSVIGGYLRKARADGHGLTQLVGREFGPTAAHCLGAVAGLATVLGLVATVMAGVALIDAATPLRGGWTILIVAVLIMACAIFGTTAQPDLGWVPATVVVLAVVVCGALAPHVVGGWGGLRPALVPPSYLNLLGGGAGENLGTGLSVALGVLVQLGAAQALQPTSALRAAKGGMSVAAVLVPVVGVSGVLVGLAMRTTQPGIRSDAALPLFMIAHLPGPLAGIVLAVLLVCVVGTGAALGRRTAEMLTNLPQPAGIRPRPVPRRTKAKRLYAALVVMLVLAALLAGASAGGSIIGWSLWSLRLIGLAGIVALTAALFWPGRLDKRWAIAACVAGPVCALIGAVVLPRSIDPVWPGLAAVAILLAIGLVVGRTKHR